MTDHPDITSRLASAFAAGKREGLEEAAKRCDQLEAEEAKYGYNRAYDLCARTIRALSSAPPVEAARYDARGMRVMTAADAEVINASLMASTTHLYDIEPPPTTAHDEDAYPDLTDEQFATIKASVADRNRDERQRDVIAGLEEAIAIASGEKQPARSTTYSTPATAQPRSEEGGDVSDADIERVARALWHAAGCDRHSDFDKPSYPAGPDNIRNLARHAIAAYLTTPSPKPEDALWEAAAAFLAKVEALQPSIDGMCQIGAIHGMPWSAGDWVKERDTLRAALAKEGE